MARAGADIYERFFHNLPTMMAAVDYGGLFVDVNSAWETVLGRAAGSLAGTPCLDLVHPEDRERVALLKKKVIEGEPQALFEARFLCRDGSHKWFHMRCAADREKSLIYVAASDITSRKATEQALRESEETRRKILDAAPMAMAIVNIDGVIEYINRKAVEVFGYPHSDIPTMERWWQQAYPDPAYRKEVVDTWMGRVYKAYEAGTEIPGGEFRVTRKDGRVITCYIFGVIAAGKVFVMFDDISRRVEAQNALRENAENLRRVLDLAPIAIGLRDARTGDLDYINEAFTATFGYDLKDILTFRDWMERTLPAGPHIKDWKDNWAKLAEEVRKTGVFPTGEYELTCKDGSRKTIILRGVLTPDDKILGIFEDVTARELTLRNLKESARTLDRIIEQAPIAMTVTSLDGKLELTNRKFTEVFGYTREDLFDLEAMARKAYPDEAYRREVMSYWAGVAASARPGRELPPKEFRVRCKDGSFRTVICSSVITPDNKVVTVNDDVTARLQAEQAVRDSERTLRQILEQAPLAIAIQNFDNGLEFLNRKFFEYFGYTREELPDLESWARRAYPDEQYRRELVAFQAGAIKKALEGDGEMEPIEVVAVCKDGTRKKVLITGMVTPDRKIVSLLEDITARVKAADAIRESEATLRLVLEQAPVAISIARVDGKMEFLNRKQVETFGYTLADAPDQDTLMRLAYPDEEYRRSVAAAWRERVETSLRTGREMEGAEYRIRCKNGDRKTIYASGVVLPDRRIILLSEDITARVEAERALRERESLYRALIETTGTGYVILDGQGKVLDANREYVRLSGHSDLKEIMGRSVLEWSHDRKRAWEAVEIVVRDGHLSNFELDYADKAGKLTTIEINATVVSRNGARQILGLCRDVSARSKTEAQLRDSESLYRALVETTRTGYVVVDSGGKVIDANREYVRLSGHSDLKEILGRSVVEWTAPDLAEQNAAAVARCARDGHIFNFETDYIDKSGKRTTIEINATVVSRGGGPQIHTLCRDITERRRTSEELRLLNQGLEARVRERTAELSAANEDLMQEISQRVQAEKDKTKLGEELQQAQKMEAVGRMAGGIAHDFNNILVSISGYAEFLLKTLPEGSQGREDIAEILLETEKGASLTRQLLTFSRKQPIKAKVLDLNEVVAETEKMLKRLVGANIRFEKSLAPAVDRITADPGQISQVIMNLVLNARDAMPEGGRITLETRNAEIGADYMEMRLAPKPGHYVLLSVSDTGSGMSPEAMQHIFEPFFTTKEEGKGTGLGLPTVYGIVSQARGGIAVKSEPGKGSTFSVYFPRTLV